MIHVDMQEQMAFQKRLECRVGSRVLMACARALLVLKQTKGGIEDADCNHSCTASCCIRMVRDQAHLADTLLAVVFDRQDDALPCRGAASPAVAESGREAYR